MLDVKIGPSGWGIAGYELIKDIVRRLNNGDYNLMHIQSLSLDIGEGYGISSIPFFISRELITARLLNIRTLELGGIPFPWGAPAPNIRKLILRPVSIPLDELLEHLRALPMLEMLTLSLSRDDSPSAPSASGIDVPVALPRLKGLYLQDSFDKSAHLMRCIRPHHSVHIDIFCAEDYLCGTDVTEVDLVNDCIRSYLMLPHRPEIRNVSANLNRCSDSHSASIILSFSSATITANSSGFSRSESGLQIHINIIDNPEMEISIHGLLKRMLLSTPQDEWTHLHLSSEIEWTNTEIWDTLRAAKNLQELHLQDLQMCLLVTLFENLDPIQVAIETPERDGIVLCPRLGALVFEDGLLDCPHEDCGGPGSLAFLISRTLKMRCLMICGAPKVRVKRCDGVTKKGHIDVWRKYTEVEWDEYRECEAHDEHWSSDEEDE